MTRQTRASYANTEDSVEMSDAEPPLSISTPPLPSPIKRIKLIVRRPPPTVSHPLQRPNPPRFGDSVSAYLQSYVTLDGQEVDEVALAGRAAKEAAEWRTIDRLRAQGRLLRPPPDDDEVTGVGGALSGRTKRDVWDEILDCVKARNGEPFAHGKVVAAQISAIVKVYWEGQAVRQDKARVVEEKRLRALAKTTIRMVTAEWKRAVFVSNGVLVWESILMRCFEAHSRASAAQARGRRASPRA